MTETIHQTYMQQALSLAELGRLTVSPNPMVGCLIVKNNQIVGQGFHERCGQAHAEVIALNQAQEKAQDASAYVTLEPCCHFGRTPPCVNALIQAGIKEIYVATLDPNPLVAGKGVEILRQVGIKVNVGILEEPAKKLNEIFFHYIQHKRPFIIAKWAMSLDGKTITHMQDSRAISGDKAAQLTHQLRQQVDAILVGKNTVLSDNPQLTVRSITNIHQQPLRIVLSSQGLLPLDSHLFNSEQAKTLIVTTDQCDTNWYQAAKQKAEIIKLPTNSFNRVSLTALLDELGKREISSLLIEGGMTVHEDFFREKLVNKVHVYLSPVIIGSQDKKHFISSMQCNELGNDFYFTANL